MNKLQKLQNLLNISALNTSTFMNTSVKFDLRNISDHKERQGLLHYVTFSEEEEKYIALVSTDDTGVFFRIDQNEILGIESIVTASEIKIFFNLADRLKDDMSISQRKQLTKLRSGVLYEVSYISHLGYFAIKVRANIGGTYDICITDLYRYGEKWRFKLEIFKQTHNKCGARNDYLIELSYNLSDICIFRTCSHWDSCEFGLERKNKEIKEK